MIPNARYFVSKGFAVFMPLRVGYGETGGPDVEFSGKCDARNYPPVYEAAAVQTLRVIEYAKTLPYIDPANGLVVGQSFGGTTAAAIAAKNVAGVKGAMNFAGGGGGRPDTHPGQPCSQDRMTELFASYGASARIPTLWLYSETTNFGATRYRGFGTRPSSTAAAPANSSSFHRTRPTAIPSSRAILPPGSRRSRSSFESCCRAVGARRAVAAPAAHIHSQRYARGLHAGSRSLGQEAQRQAGGHRRASRRPHCASGRNWRR